ncbi:MAG: hypothetical protein FD130_95 [Halothiobacillaceae bacterium]|nr:MAG: hypothetical protein FD130_95 [Halothiobacillaceae bacterium]
MQIDFHHAATYVIARAAGFMHEQANIIAYCSQYVDDATSEGTVYFDNRAVYTRISSAHKMLDLRNTEELANHHVWMAFHLLPGNGQKRADESLDQAGFINKIICRPNSPVAQEMVRLTILGKDRAYGLHRLGVAMHVYADTWAHQGFAGVMHDVNEVEDARETGNSGVFDNRLDVILDDLLDDAIPPLGHGRANVFPDIPFLEWEYTNGKNERVIRNNPKDFLEAADYMCIAMRRYRLGDPDASVVGLDGPTKDKLDALFRGIKIKQGVERHAQWLQAIRNGAFTVCGAVAIEDYEARGKASWKAQALGTSHDLPVHRYNDSFLESNWKLFHDALLAHRFHVIHDILPKYGICAA